MATSEIKEVHTEQGTILIGGMTLNVEITATGTRREDGRTAAEVEADMKREKEANGS